MWLKQSRQALGWTQNETASRLGLSQPYLSLLETGKRNVPHRLVSKLRKFFDVPPTVLSPREVGPGAASVLAEELGSLGYEPFAYLRKQADANPAEVLLAALRQDNLESRLTEALPWLVLTYPNLNWDWLLERSKVHDVQNRLGYVITMARQLADRAKLPATVSKLLPLEQTLSRSRLAEEGTLCQESMTDAERRWLRDHRPESASDWNLLTDLKAEDLPYAA
jgi:transcriptional regulator with XRE-family HTH domain